MIICSRNCMAAFGLDLIS